MKLLIRRRKRKNTEVKNQGGVEAPEIESRVSKRRDFRINRLKEKTKLLSQRKWVFMAIAVIVVALAAVAFKIL